MPYLLTTERTWPRKRGPCHPAKNTTVRIHLYVEDVDATFQRAVDAGARSVMPPTDAYWGDRFAKVADPFGHLWSIATHIKDLSLEQIAEAAKSAFSKAPC